MRDKTRPPGRNPLTPEIKAKVLAKTTTETRPNASHWSARTMAKGESEPHQCAAPWQHLRPCGESDRARVRSLSLSCLAPERLLRASLLQAFYSVRSKRQFIGRSTKICTFACDRLLDADVAAKFPGGGAVPPQGLAVSVGRPFLVDGTLVEAWANLKSIRAAR